MYGDRMPWAGAFTRVRCAASWTRNTAIASKHNLTIYLGKPQHGSCGDAMHNPTSEVRNEPFPLCFDRQDLTVQFPKPTDAAFWHCCAALPKFVEASRQKVKLVPIYVTQ
jgi:hypothetical protein